MQGTINPKCLFYLFGLRERVIKVELHKNNDNNNNAIINYFSLAFQTFPGGPNRRKNSLKGKKKGERETERQENQMRFFSSFAKLLYATVLPATTTTATTTQTKTSSCAEKFLNAITSASANPECLFWSYWSGPLFVLT